MLEGASTTHAGIPGAPRAGAGQALTETQLLSIIRSEMDLTALAGAGAAQEDRRRFFNAYLGQPRGDERAGRSRVVSRATYETVEWAKPLILTVFFGGPDVVQFRPQGADDEEQAEQRTQAADYIFRRANDGFQVLHDAITDALTRRSGWVKVWLDESIQRERERYYGKTAAELAELLEPKDSGSPWRIVAQEPAGQVMLEAQDPVTGEMTMVPEEAFDVEVMRDRPASRIRVEAVPPAEVWVNPDARSPYDDTCRFVQHRQTKMTESRALAMGLDPERVRRVPSSSGSLWDTEELELAQRRASGGGLWQRNERNDAERQITVSECYARVDLDGDGITEWVRAYVGGDYGEVLLDWEPARRHPFAQIQCIRLPHAVEGLALAETVEDLNDIDTTVRRMFLDNLYFSVQGRWTVLNRGAPGESATPMADLNQLAQAIPGSWVDIWQDGAIQTLGSPVDIAPLLETMNLLTEDRHRRTGISPEALGVDPEAISKTVFGAMAQQNAGQVRSMLSAMLVASGVRRIYELIDEALLSNPTQTLQLKLRGKWVPIDPGEWKTKLQAEVVAGLGAGGRLERSMSLQSLLEVLKVGREGGLGWITDENLHNAISDLARNMGFRAPERYVTDPAEHEPPPQPEDPKAVEMAYKHHIDSQRLLLERDQLLLKQKELELTHEREILKLRIEAKEAGMKFDESWELRVVGQAPAPPAPQGPLPPVAAAEPQPVRVVE